MASEDRVEVQNWTNNVRNTNNVQKKREIDLARHDPGLNRVPAGMRECCGMEVGADRPPRSSRFLAYTQNMMSPVLQEKDVEKANRTRPGLEPGSWLIFGKELLQIRLESLVCGC